MICIKWFRCICGKIKYKNLKYDFQNNVPVAQFRIFLLNRKTNLLQILICIYNFFIMKPMAN